MKNTIIVLSCVLIVLVICYIIKFGKVNVPDNSECIATIIQSNKSNKYYLSYEFYKINGKCVYKKWKKDNCTLDGLEEYLLNEE